MTNSALCNVFCWPLSFPEGKCVLHCWHRNDENSASVYKMTSFNLILQRLREAHSFYLMRASKRLREMFQNKPHMLSQLVLKLKVVHKWICSFLGVYSCALQLYYLIIQCRQNYIWHCKNTGTHKSNKMNMIHLLNTSAT